MFISWVRNMFVLSVRMVPIGVRNSCEMVASRSRSSCSACCKTWTCCSVRARRTAAWAAAERLKRIAPDRTVEWDLKEAGVTVLADWDSLGQILDNLLDNANRFAPLRTPITVRVDQQDPGRVGIRVIDRGPGVPAAMRERLFTRFVKGPSDSGDGTGLGLAITRGLVEAHAGSITLEDDPPGETRFRFTLPKEDS